ncbi:hypothetical protein PMI25_003059 [Pseudomonas sp. GM30]|nr:hypothetical protein PMI25_003059 [Pseudomonas sp. GM30]
MDGIAFNQKLHIHHRQTSFLWPTQTTVGAGLPAMGPCQSPSFPTDPPPSLASQLPQGYLLLPEFAK